MRRGQEIHNEIIEREFDSDPCLVAILVDAYAKCGIFEDATAVIGLLPDANTLVSLLKDCVFEKKKTFVLQILHSRCGFHDLRRFKALKDLAIVHE